MADKPLTKSHLVVYLMDYAGVTSEQDAKGIADEILGRADGNRSAQNYRPQNNNNYWVKGAVDNLIAEAELKQKRLLAIKEAINK